MQVLGVMNLGLCTFKILPATFQWLVRVAQNHESVVELGGPGEEELTANTISPFWAGMGGYRPFL